MSQPHRQADSTPRWVKLFGIIAPIVIVLLGILHFSGGHGPGSHMSSGEIGAGTPSAGMMSDSTPPSEQGG